VRVIIPGFHVTEVNAVCDVYQAMGWVLDLGIDDNDKGACWRVACLQIF
jgi:hypothetical protein